MSDMWYLETVDFVRPVQAVIPGAQGRVFAVLAETTAELNVRTIARLSGVSVAQASRVLPSLVDLGLVERREVPPSVLFRFVPEHVAARAVTALSRARDNVLEELGRAAAALDHRPDSVIAFGSFARGEADVHSDIDVVMVRPVRIEEDDEHWRAAVAAWRMQAQRLTGNGIELVEISRRDVARLLRSRKPMWVDFRRDGIVVYGSTIEAMSDRRSA